MKCPTFKQVPITEVGIGEEFVTCGIAGEGEIWIGGGLYIGEDRNVHKKEDDSIVENVIYIKRRYTLEEEQEWYECQYDISCGNAAINLVGLYNDMYFCEGEHEMYNSWSTYDWYEMSDNLENENFYLYGIAPAPYPCSAFGEEDSIALVIEDFLTGNRYWCHSSKEWIENMREQMKEIYEIHIEQRGSRV